LVYKSFGLISDDIKPFKEGYILSSMQLETVLTDSLSVKDSLTTQKSNYIRSTEQPLLPLDTNIKTNYDPLIYVGALITIYSIFHYIRKKAKE